MKTKASKILEKKFPEERTIQFDQDIAQKANDMDVLIKLIKTKLNTTVIKREKFQVLTLVPVLWSRKKVCEIFNVTEYAVRKAKDRLRHKGIIALSESRKGHSVGENMIATVKNFFQSDE